MLVEDEGSPIKAFLDKDEYEGDTPSIQDLGSWFSEDADVAIFMGENGYITSLSSKTKIRKSKKNILVMKI